MKHFDLIYEIAADNYGIVTAGEAAEAGVHRQELARYAKAGWLVRLGNGVYRLARYIPTSLDAYAEAVALVGPESWIHGESVLAMCGLALASPPQVSVATRRRVRRSLPAWVEVVRPGKGEEPVRHEGIPAQPVADAIRTCRSVVLPERLADAIEEALAGGLVDEREAVQLREELGS